MNHAMVPISDIAEYARDGVAANKAGLILYLHINIETVELRDGMRNVRTIGHRGTGDLGVRIRQAQDVEAARPLIQKAYEGQV